MKRTAAALPLTLFLCATTAPAQETSQDPGNKTQGASLQSLVEKMKAAEQAARSVYLEMRTTGSFPGGLGFRTEGSIRVLKTEHLRVHTRMEFHSDDGIEGREESVRTEEGVWTVKDDPVFGEVYLHMDQALMRDLEWAGEVLGQTGSVQGTMDAGAGSPLGSALVEDLARQYDLQVREGPEIRDGQEGFWLGGNLRADIAPESEPDMPLPDRVELFIRKQDAAVLEMVHFKDGKPILEIEITRLELNRPMEEASFRLDVGDRQPQDIREYPPDWAQIERTLEEAEAASEQVRPSKRKA